MSDIWAEDKILKFCDEAELWVPQFFLTNPVESDDGQRWCWVIGQYRDLKMIARLLRTDKKLRDAFSARDSRFEYEEELGNLLFGLRETDRPRAGKSRRSIGPLGKPRSTVAELKNRYAKKRESSTSQAFEARTTDIHPEHKLFWESRTFEAHHIVEDNILETLKVNTDELARRVAPCVLLVAEMHQRLLTTEMASKRGDFSSKMSADQAFDKLTEIYDDLYANPLMIQLKAIANVIIEEVQARLILRENALQAKKKALPAQK
jgi:hypothetical protein